MKKIQRALALLNASISIMIAFSSIQAGAIEATNNPVTSAEPTQTASGYLIPEPTPQTETIDENTIVRSYEFTATQRPFSYTEAPQKLVFEGRQYTKLADSEEYYLKSEGVHYDIETKEFTQTEEKQGVSSRNDELFDPFYHVNQEGYEGEIPRFSVTYATSQGNSATTTKTTSVSYGAHIETPTAPDTLTKNGQTYKFTSWKTGAGEWEKNFYADLRLESDSIVYRFASNKSFNLESDTPKWANTEFDLMEEMQLDAGTHVIDSAKWLNSLQYDGEMYSRKIQFTISRYVTSYTAIYSAEISVKGAETLNAQATYKGTLEKQIENGTEYTVICKVTYTTEPLPTNAPTPTPEPTETPEVIEAMSDEVTEKKGMNPVLKFVLLIVVAGGVGGGALFFKNWWDKRQADNEEE